MYFLLDCLMSQNTIFVEHVDKDINCEEIHSSGCEAVATCFYDLGLSWLGFEHKTFCLRGSTLTDCATAVVLLDILPMKQKILYHL